LGDDDEIVIVANGGTTAQLVPLIVRLAKAASVEDTENSIRYNTRGSAEERRWSWKAIDLQMDGVTVLA
jgi:hypothetical protein